MELKDLVARLDGLSDDTIICAKRPWTGSAEAMAVEPNDDLSMPADVTKAGFAYLAEVHVAKEVFQAFRKKSPTLEDKVRLLVHYAEHDAYPDWVYSE